MLDDSWQGYKQNWWIFCSISIQPLPTLRSCGVGRGPRRRWHEGRGSRRRHERMGWWRGCMGGGMRDSRHRASPSSCLSAGSPRRPTSSRGELHLPSTVYPVYTFVYPLRVAPLLPRCHVCECHHSCKSLSRNLIKSFRHVIDYLNLQFDRAKSIILIMRL